MVAFQSNLGSYLPNVLMLNLSPTLKTLSWPNIHIHSCLFSGYFWFRKAFLVKSKQFKTPRTVCMHVVLSMYYRELLWIHICIHRKSCWCWFLLWREAGNGEVEKGWKCYGSELLSFFSLLYLKNVFKVVVL